MSDHLIEDDDAMVDALVELAKVPMSFLRIGDLWDRVKVSRGASFATCAMGLMQAARETPTFDLRAELLVLARRHPSLRLTRNRRFRKSTVAAGVVLVVGYLSLSIHNGKLLMGDWALKIVEITGVPGLGLLVLYFYAKPIAERVGLSKVGVKMTERVVLILTIGLLLVAISGMIIYGLPSIIRAVRETSTTRAV
jgi:hypothetical protein